MALAQGRPSFNEVEALAAKAARGAGLGWGHAKDLGRASGGLPSAASRGLGHCCGSSTALQRPPARLTSTVPAADRASSAAPGESWRVGDDGDAVCVVPLLAASIYARDFGLALHWPRLMMRVSPKGAASVSCVPFDLTGCQGPLTIEARTDTSPLEHQLPLAARPALLWSDIEASLSGYAARIAVPVSVASRALGAGSERSDDD